MADKITVVSSATATMSFGTTFRAPNYVRPPDDHPIYQLVGRVAAEWGYFERTLDSIIWSLSGVISARAACLTGQLIGAGPRFRAILAQLHLRQSTEPRFEKHVSKINKLSNDSFEPQEQRNRIVHDAWYVDSELNKTGQFRTWPAKNLSYGINEVDMAGIENTIAKIKLITKRGIELYEQINADVAASPQRQPERPSSSPRDPAG